MAPTAGASAEFVVQIDEAGAGHVGGVVLASPLGVVGEVETHVAHDQIGVFEAVGEVGDGDQRHLATVAQSPADRQGGRPRSTARWPTPVATRNVTTVVTFADKPILTGDRVVLRPIVASDSEHMWSDIHDAEAARLTGSHGAFERRQLDEWCASRAAQADRLDLAVTERSTGVWLGEVVINDWDADNRSCGFRIALGPNARDRGFGTEATCLVVDYVFDVIDDPPVNRIALEVYDFNPRAAAVYDTVGFRREGVLRQALSWEGRFHDAIVMAIVRSDRTR